MSDNYIVVVCMVLRSICTMGAIYGAVILAMQGKEGWGWMIFLAVILGSFSLNFKGGE